MVMKVDQRMCSIRSSPYVDGNLLSEAIITSNLSPTSDEGLFVFHQAKSN